MADPFVGEIRLFGFPRVPDGWLACNGQALQIADYDALYTVIGTAFGGDGAQTFKLPDLQGRVPVGQGTGQSRTAYQLGQSAGEEAHGLTAAEVPAHTHALMASPDPATTATPGDTVILGVASAGKLYAPKGDAGTYGKMKACITSEGSGAGHDNMLPSVVGNYCICVNGVFPA